MGPSYQKEINCTGEILLVTLHYILVCWKVTYLGGKTDTNLPYNADKSILKNILAKGCCFLRLLTGLFRTAQILHVETVAYPRILKT